MVYGNGVRIESYEDFMKPIDQMLKAMEYSNFEMGGEVININGYKITKLFPKYLEGRFQILDYLEGYSNINWYEDELFGDIFQIEIPNAKYRLNKDLYNLKEGIYRIEGYRFDIYRNDSNTKIIELLKKEVNNHPIFNLMKAKK